MIKNISIWTPEKNKEKFELQIKESSSYGEIFDLAFELRQFAINGMQEMQKQDKPAEQPVVEPVVIEE
jgi:hypothetical protein